MFTGQDWLAVGLIGQGWLAGWLARTDCPALGNALLATEWLAGCPPQAWLPSRLAAWVAVWGFRALHKSISEPRALGCRL